MTARDALKTWLLANLPIVSVSTEPAIAEDALPGAILVYDSQRGGDTLDADLRIERYTLALVPHVVGATLDERVTSLAAMEKALVEVAGGPDRNSGGWQHIEASITAPGADASLWQVDVWVSGA